MAAGEAAGQTQRFSNGGDFRFNDNRGRETMTARERSWGGGGYDLRDSRGRNVGSIDRRGIVRDERGRSVGEIRRDWRR